MAKGCGFHNLRLDVEDPLIRNYSRTEKKTMEESLQDFSFEKTDSSAFVDDQNSLFYSFLFWEGIISRGSPANDIMGQHILDLRHYILDAILFICYRLSREELLDKIKEIERANNELAKKIGGSISSVTKTSSSSLGSNKFLSACTEEYLEEAYPLRAFPMAEAKTDMVLNIMSNLKQTKGAHNSKHQASGGAVNSSLIRSLDPDANLDNWRNFMFHPGSFRKCAFETDGVSFKIMGLLYDSWKRKMEKEKNRKIHLRSTDVNYGSVDHVIGSLYHLLSMYQPMNQIDPELLVGAFSELKGIPIILCINQMDRSQERRSAETSKFMPHFRNSELAAFLYLFYDGSKFDLLEPVKLRKITEVKMLDVFYTELETKRLLESKFRLSDLQKRKKLDPIDLQQGVLSISSLMEECEGSLDSNSFYKNEVSTCPADVEIEAPGPTSVAAIEPKQAVLERTGCSLVTVNWTLCISLLISKLSHLFGKKWKSKDVLQSSNDNPLQHSGDNDLSVVLGQLGPTEATTEPRKIYDLSRPQKGSCAFLEARHFLQSLNNRLSDQTRKLEEKIYLSLQNSEYNSVLMHWFSTVHRKKGRAKLLKWAFDRVQYNYLTQAESALLLSPEDSRSSSINEFSTKPRKIVFLQPKDACCWSNAEDLSGDVKKLGDPVYAVPFKVFQEPQAILSFNRRQKNYGLFGDALVIDLKNGGLLNFDSIIDITDPLWKYHYLFEELKLLREFPFKSSNFLELSQVSVNNGFEYSFSKEYKQRIGRVSSERIKVSPLKKISLEDSDLCKAGAVLKNFDNTYVGCIKLNSFSVVVDSKSEKKAQSGIFSQFPNMLEEHNPAETVGRVVMGMATFLDDFVVNALDGTSQTRPDETGSTLPDELTLQFKIPIDSIGLAVYYSVDPYANGAPPEPQVGRCSATATTTATAAATAASSKISTGPKKVRKMVGVKDAGSGFPLMVNLNFKQLGKDLQISENAAKLGVVYVCCTDLGGTMNISYPAAPTLGSTPIAENTEDLKSSAGVTTISFYEPPVVMQETYARIVTTLIQEIK